MTKALQKASAVLWEAESDLALARQEEVRASLELDAIIDAVEGKPEANEPKTDPEGSKE